MAQYFNRNDREHHLAMLVNWDYLSTWVERTKCLEQEEKKWIRTATTYLKKASDCIVKRAERSYITSLKNEARNSSLIIIDERKKVYKEEYADAKTVITDDLYNLFDFALTACTDCKGCNFHDCERFKLFIKMGVPAVEEITNDCPYKN